MIWIDLVVLGAGCLAFPICKSAAAQCLKPASCAALRLEAIFRTEEFGRGGYAELESIDMANHGHRMPYRQR